MGPSVALSSVKLGKLKMLAFGSEKRVPQFPDVPTIAETVPGYEANVSFGLFAAAGTPADIIKKANADVQKIVTDPEFQKKYLEPFAVQPVPGPVDAFAEYLRKDSAQWGAGIKAANVKIEVEGVSQEEGARLPPPSEAAYLGGKPWNGLTRKHR